MPSRVLCTQYTHAVSLDRHCLRPGPGPGPLHLSSISGELLAVRLIRPNLAPHLGRHLPTTHQHRAACKWGRCAKRQQGFRFPSSSSYFSLVAT